MRRASAPASSWRGALAESRRAVGEDMRLKQQIRNSEELLKPVAVDTTLPPEQITPQELEAAGQELPQESPPHTPEELETAQRELPQELQELIAIEGLRIRILRQAEAAPVLQKSPA